VTNHVGCTTYLKGWSGVRDFTENPGIAVTFERERIIAIAGYDTFITEGSVEKESLKGVFEKAEHDGHSLGREAQSCDFSRKDHQPYLLACMK
jgi:hypothetical protein